MPRLAAEEELIARAAASHPYLEPKDQTQIFARLARAAGIQEPVRKPTRADLGALGINVVGD